MEFNEKFDLREDPDLVDGMSHRLHWDEHPGVWKLRDSGLSLEELLSVTIHWSFSNEKWTNLLWILEKGWDTLPELFEQERCSRSDLFQIYYSKGTKVKEWLVEKPRQISKDLLPMFEGKNRPLTIMEFAKNMEMVLKQKYNFRSCLYPCKNVARYIGMSHPHLVDPESIIIGGTGHFRGLMYIFGSPNLDGKLKYHVDSQGEFIPDNKHTLTWMKQMDTLIHWENNPITRQKWLGHEDQTCWFSKFVERKHGDKPRPKKFPRIWMFPDDFSLKKV